MFYLIFTLLFTTHCFSMEQQDYKNSKPFSVDLDHWADEKETKEDHYAHLPGTWRRKTVIADEKLKDSAFKVHGFIRRTDEYKPDNLDENRNDSTTFIVVHGTFGSSTPSFHDDTHITDKNYYHMKNYAAHYAEKNRTKVNFKSFQWTGDLSDLSRGNSAIILSDYIKDKHKDARIVFMTHSHGGNIVNQVTHIINNPTDLIYFACPVRKEYLANHPKNFDKLVYFHSDYDWTARAGRLHEETLAKKAVKSVALGLTVGVGAKLLFNQLTSYNDIARDKTKEKVTNLVFLMYKTKGINPDPSHFKTIEEIAYKHYPDYSSFTTGVSLATGVIRCGTNLYHNLLTPNTTSHNIFPGQPKDMIGIHSRIDGKPLGHSAVTNMAQFLPEIMNQLETAFPTHKTNMLLEAEANSTDGSVVLTYDFKRSVPKVD